MTVQQALQFLMQIAEQAPVAKQLHVQAEKAFQIVNQFIVEKTEKKEAV